ncbi:hypothetical protein LTR08_001278 [Meristemomyces frigidus]|nr:hypothetical protein LTR08_001278 [Meristemomyces frigidus]
MRSGCRKISKYYHAMVDPPIWPTSENEEFVYYHQFLDKHNRICGAQQPSEQQLIDTVTDGFAYFSCYRVRPNGNFSQTQGDA